MDDYPIGSWRKTAGGQIGVAGRGFRLYDVFLKGISISATGITFYAGNSASAASTANALLVVKLDGSNPTYNSYSCAGMLFVGGCYMTTQAAIDWVTVLGAVEN